MAPTPYLLSGAGYWLAASMLALAWLGWPYLAWTAWRLVRQRPHGLRRVALAATFAGTAVLLYAHFIEPRRLTQRHTALQLGFKARIALIGDYHMGLFKGPAFLDQVVDALNAMDVDAVLIAGDHLNYPERPLVELLAPLKRLRHAAFSVPGNHDDHPGEPERTHDLREALRAVGVTPVEYTHVVLPRFTVVGLGDHFAGRDGRGPLTQAPRDKPIIVLFHNPDTAMTLKAGDAALAVAGHTHGGQMRIPWLYQHVIPTQHPFDRGLHTFPPVPTFVTSGLGESGLPLRLFNPPTIDVLEID